MKRESIPSIKNEYADLYRNLEYESDDSTESVKFNAILFESSLSCDKDAYKTFKLYPTKKFNIYLDNIDTISFLHYNIWFNYYQCVEKTILKDGISLKFFKKQQSNDPNGLYSTLSIELKSFDCIDDVIVGEYYTIITKRYLEDYSKREEDVKCMSEWTSNIEYIDDHNEYVVPMINTDADW